MTEEEISWRQPHQTCHKDLAYEMGYRPDKRPNIELMHLTALRVCRQVFNEANHVLWTTNTFSFDDADPTFNAFIDSRTTRQKQLLRNLRLCMDWVYEDDQSWNRALRVTLIKSLTGLRSLRLQINHSMDAALYRGAKELGLYPMRQLQFVENLATLSLMDVEGFVSDFPRFVDDPPGFDSDDPAPSVNLCPQWTAEDRIEFAE